MNNYEFLQEALNSPECPEGFEQTYSYFCKYQRMAIDTLNELVRIFDKNNIYYQLAFGSVLGAIRDNGQIPWDYDVDLNVPFYEREKLLKALDNDLSSKFCYFTPEQEGNYRPSFIRVLPKGYYHHSIHVDIFYLIGLPENPIDREEYCLQVQTAVKSRRYVLQKLSEYDYSMREKLTQAIKSIYYKLRYGKRSTKYNIELFGRYDIRLVPEAANISAKCGVITVPSKIYLNSMKITTEIGTFNIPEEYDTYLKSRYNDWHTYPSLKSRINAVVRLSKRFEWYENQIKKGKIKVVPSSVE